MVRLALFVVMALSGVLTAPPARVPVVVELFTSEGCSSCPPADSVLRKLASRQDVAGAEVIALGLHVTYWDQLGWKDPFSLSAATERQQAYSRVFGEDRVYTPQAVVDGADETIGSDEPAIRRAILSATRRAHAAVTITGAVDGDVLTAEVGIVTLPSDLKEKLHAWMFITEDGLTSIVRRGENSGRTLEHAAGVRTVFGGAVEAAHTLGFRATLRPEWRRERLRVVVVFQGTRTQRIWGAAATTLK